MITCTKAVSSILLLIVFCFLLGISKIIDDIVRLIVLLLIIVIIVTWLCNCSTRQSDTKAWQNYQWIQKEVKWLRALLEDKNSVSKSGEVIDKKAQDRWSTEGLKPLKTARLEGSVEGWANDTEEKTQQGRDLIEKIGKTRKIPSKEEKQLKELKEKIESVPKADIYDELAKLRSKIRRLQEGPVDNEQKSVIFDHKDCSEKIDQLLEKLDPKKEETLGQLLLKKPVGEMEGPVRKARLHLLLLRAFLHDLGGLALGSEMEKAWVTEAKELVAKVSSASSQLKKRKPWSSIWSSTKGARRELEEFNNGLSDLFEKKRRYGFQFIRGEPWQASRNETLDDKNLLSELKELSKRVSDGSVKFKEVFSEKFEKVLAESEAAIAKEGITGSTKERSDQMNNLIKEANGSVERYERNAAKESGLPKINAQKILDREKKLIMEDLDLLGRSIEAYTIELNKDTGSVVALEEDTDAVVSLLTSGGVKPFVVSIVGMRGIGKTTLAKKAFECIKARTHFEHCFWVHIPDQVAHDRIPELVAEKVGAPGSPEGQNLIIKVRSHLMQKGTYLVVLDNIATEDWRAVGEAFPKTDGSRILLTTRNKDVAADEGEGRQIHALRLRTKEESWRLFQARVDLPDSVNKLAERIVGKCGGLPLEILDFAYLMAGIDVEDPQLADKLKDIDLCPSPSSENSGLTKKHLNPSPWSESFNLAKGYWNKDKPCGRFLEVFLIFLEDYEIPARRLLAFWHAREDGDEETKTQDHLKDLIDSNMIQVVDGNLDEEDMKYCLPKFLRRRREWELKWDPSSNHTDDRSLKAPHLHLGDNFFLSFYTGEGPKPGEEIAAELRRVIRGKKFLSLRVLDLEHAFKPQLPDSIKNLTELRYLGLRWTYIQIIPSSIGKLTNLQTLDIEHTCIREVPDSIWGLKKLRHLYLNHSYRSKIVHQRSANYLIKFSQPNSLNSFKNLQTLSGVFIDEDSFQPHQLNKLTSLTKLGLAFELTPSNGKKLTECVVNFTQLKSLRLSSIDEFGKPKDLWLEPLPGKLEKLSSLYLCGKLTAYGQSVEGKFPESLCDLTLSASGLTADPMPILGEHLRSLKSLCFYSDSYRGKKMVSRKGDFPKLLVLRLRKLELLEEMQVEEGAMENLRELEIRSCGKLQVPIGLKHLKSLQELKLLDMPENFKEEEVRKQIWSTWPEIAYSPMIINDYQKI